MRAVPRPKRTDAKPGEGRAGTLAALGLGVGFVVWASLFIYRSSVLAFDGNRYFVLFDDAMISMRYGWNLAHGLGLVWNAGEYVEGYTNPLMTLVMALASAFFDKSGAVLAVQVFGVALMLANAYLVMRIAEHLFADEAGRHRGLLRALAFLCGLSYYPLLFWSLLGMETGLLAVLVSLSVLFVLRYVRDGEPVQGALVSVALGLAFLTRPDAVVFALPIFLYAFYGVPKAFAPPRLLALFGPLALFVAGHQAFRWAYYGELLPNTYTLKVSGVPLLERISNGASFTVPFLEETWVLLALAGAALLLDRRRGPLLLAGVFGVTLLYQVWTGGDAWNLWRIFSPAMPLVLVLGVRAILRAVSAASDAPAYRELSGRSRALRLLPGLVSVLAVLAVLAFVNLRFAPEITMQRQSEEEYLNERRMSVALALREFTTPDATVGLFGVGTIPYYTGGPGLDFLGKMDPRVANLPPDDAYSRPGHNKFDLEYSIKELRPTHAQGFEWHGQSVLEWARNEYVGVKYKDAHLNLLKGSNEVRWDKLDAAVARGEATLTTPR
ncbi:hypothetical protein GBA65_18540 [Rubrobacter marinus]|uniref:Uncharacterized protein n=1 Tax=Rubrobacter marinus TaxID=2653852 RepID=A0A6G8Q125_9ACTN|nr:glycosyltransferase family 39 protein [Rubrobacter marinus]QIN80184.1 hypothetical protein GBA65_18540 [Rubrobacter marinus]